MRRPVSNRRLANVLGSITASESTSATSVATRAPSSPIGVARKPAHDASLMRGIEAIVQVSIARPVPRDLRHGEGSGESGSLGNEVPSATMRRIKPAVRSTSAS